MALQVLLFALIGLLGLVNLSVAPPAGIGVVVIGIGAVVGFVGGLVLLQGVRGLGASFTAMPRPREDATLVREGIYAHIRHPIYAGLIGLAVAWSCITLSVPALAATLVLVIVLDLKARREEAWLTDRYPEYAAYRRATRRFVRGLY